MQVSLQQSASTGRELSSELSRITRQTVLYTPFTTPDAISFDIKRAMLWDVLEALSASGKVEIGGDDFSKLKRIRQSLAGGEKMAVCMHGVTVKRMVREIASLSGLPIRVTAGDPQTVVNLSVKDVTLEEFLVQLSSQSGVEISSR
ncbi:MAG: hypothetical protein LC803_22025 [Acidobacteria bacterium]|nr:hypothetical protein [Acidobacteriota bacterium]